MKAAFALSTLFPCSSSIDIADTGNIMPSEDHLAFEPKLRSCVVIHTFEEK